MNIEDASDIALMTEWLKRQRAKGDNMLTRSGRTEIRHVCLYTSGTLKDLREIVLKDGVNSGHAIIELRGVISDLEGLIKYLEGKGGGFSALDRRLKDGS